MFRLEIWVRNVESGLIAFLYEQYYITQRVTEWYRDKVGRKYEKLRKSNNFSSSTEMKIKCKWENVPRRRVSEAITDLAYSFLVILFCSLYQVLLLHVSLTQHIDKLLIYLTTRRYMVRYFGPYSICGIVAFISRYIFLLHKNLCNIGTYNKK